MQRSKNSDEVAIVAFLEMIVGGMFQSFQRNISQKRASSKRKILIASIEIKKTEIESMNFERPIT